MNTILPQCELSRILLNPDVIICMDAIVCGLVYLSVGLKSSSRGASRLAEAGSRLRWSRWNSSLSVVEFDIWLWIAEGPTVRHSVRWSSALHNQSGLNSVRLQSFWFHGKQESICNCPFESGVPLFLRAQQ